MAKRSGVASAMGGSGSHRGGATGRSRQPERRGNTESSCGTEEKRDEGQPPRQMKQPAKQWPETSGFAPLVEAL